MESLCSSIKLHPNIIGPTGIPGLATTIPNVSAKTKEIILNILPKPKVPGLDLGSNTLAPYSVGLQCPFFLRIYIYIRFFFTFAPLIPATKPTCPTLGVIIRLQLYINVYNDILLNLTRITFTRVDLLKLYSSHNPF